MDRAQGPSGNVVLRTFLLLAAAMAQPASAQPAPAQPAPAEGAPAEAVPAEAVPAQPAGAPAPGRGGVAERMEPDTAIPLLGREVVDGKGRSAGRVSDVLVDGGGQVRAVVVDLGGFMGLGQRRVPVAWQALEVSAERITLTLSVKAVAALPEYRPGRAAVVAAPPR